MSVELTEALLSKAAGWEVMKYARAYIAQGQVLSSYWAPPLLRGVVQVGEISFRASMVIKSDIDVENLCTCREAREWGKICAHGVGVGLHWLKEQQPATSPVPHSSPGRTSSPAASKRSTPTVQRDASGEPAELFLIFPPNLDQALARGKVMLVIEAKWGGGRNPLSALPKGRSYSFSAQDNFIIDHLEELAGGESPAVMQITTNDLASLLPRLADHPNISLGKSNPVSVRKAPLKLALRVSLQANGEILVESKVQGTPPVLIQDWVWQAGTFQPLGLPDSMKGVFHSPVRVSRAAVPQFLSQQWPQLQAIGGADANFKIEDFTFEPQEPRFFLELKGGLAQRAQ